jgi:sugar/nucleoside kinase (ribokinase family)
VTVPMRVIALGVHVVDVLVRPVTEIPEGQGGALVDSIRITAAGPAGGTALTLAKLGAEVHSAGAIGTDALGDVLIDLLTRAGANATYAAADAPWDAIAADTHLHLGAPEFMGGQQAAQILSFARDHGVTTSADILAPGDQAAAILDWIAPALGHLDYLLPNDEQVLGLTGADDLVTGCRALCDRGVGCGDAFSAGFLRGLNLGRDRAQAATLGCACAALVATGLGSDHGTFDLGAADALALTTPTRSPVPS